MPCNLGNYVCQRKIRQVIKRLQIAPFGLSSRVFQNQIFCYVDVYEIYPFFSLLYLIKTGALPKDQRPAGNNTQEHAIMANSKARRCEQNKNRFCKHATE